MTGAGREAPIWRSLWECVHDGPLLRTQVGALLENSIREERLARPDTIYWDTLGGSLELTVSKEDSKVLRAVDRRRVAFSYKTSGNVDRRGYFLETTYEFLEHGKSALKIPLEILKDIQRPRK